MFRIHWHESIFLVTCKKERKKERKTLGPHKFQECKFYSLFFYNSMFKRKIRILNCPSINFHLESIFHQEISAWSFLKKSQYGIFLTFRAMYIFKRNFESKQKQVFFLSKNGYEMKWNFFFVQNFNFAVKEKTEQVSSIFKEWSASKSISCFTFEDTLCHWIKWESVGFFFSSSELSSVSRQPTDCNPQHPKLLSWNRPILGIRISWCHLTTLWIL